MTKKTPTKRRTDEVKSARNDPIEKISPILVKHNPRDPDLPYRSEPLLAEHRRRIIRDGIDDATLALDSVVKVCKRAGFELGALALLIRGLIRDHGPDFMVIEEGFSRGPGSQLLHRLIGVAMAEAQHAGIGVVAVPGSTWKKAVLGSGGLSSEAAKAASIRHAQTLSSHVTDDNEADAVCISDYAERVMIVKKAA